MVLFKEFLKGQENAQDQLNENFEKLDIELQDTGWVKLTLNPGYVGWFYVRKRGNYITWRYYIGVGTNTAGASAVVCNIPVGFRSTVNHSKVLGGNLTGSTADVRFETGGNVTIRAVSNPAANFGNLETFEDFPES